MPMVADLGVGWIRDEILWGQVEREKGVYKLREHDLAWINLAHKYNLKVCLTLAGGNGLYENNFDPEAYARFAAFVAKELDGKVQAIEVQNEPFNWYAGYYGEGTTSGGDWYGLDVKTGEVQSWLDHYRVMLNAAADAVKEANPDMKVIGLGSFPAINYRQIEGGLAGTVDGITAHPYSYRTVPELVPYAAGEKNFTRNGNRDVADAEGTFASFIKMMRAFSAEYDGPQEIWLTEWGFSNFRLRGNHRGNYWGFTEQAAAAYAQRRFIEGFALDVEMSAIYSLLDDRYNMKSKPLETSLNSENNFGLITSSGRKKPVYDAVRKVAIATDGFTPTDVVKVTVEPRSSRPDGNPVSWWDGTTLSVPDRIANYQFLDKNGNVVIALWSMERVNDLAPRPADVTIDIPFDDADDLVVEDLITGDTYPVLMSKTDDGKLLLPDLGVPPHPILIHLGENI
ncbi:hypothetical protein [Ruficoccus sp. ZRK36]|uniref:hypothetical protein n=1 Tax=Ruficoccus sp. ZRK36 TaxID=2866311 RepID=UPI001C72F98F|nr:hypothetical protein [Ruficoccus sp. ZRK36]QYY35025.1 hypothetical protein K0V07_12020 [Ruficoccus sp. ZRK36]